MIMARTIIMIILVNIKNMLFEIYLCIALKKNKQDVIKALLTLITNH